MKMVVFGGSGFVGSHVADALTAGGHEVAIFDRAPSPFVKDDQQMLVGDLFDVEQVSEVVSGADAVFHFAGMSDIQEANERPLEAVKSNILGTAHVLEACRRHRVGRFLFASSIYVYSEQGGVYRSSKQSCELLIENYAKLYNVDFTILRFGSLYGSRANHFNFIRNIICQALTEGKMERAGDGGEVRDYIHVVDAAKACVAALDHKYKNDYLMITGAQSVKVRDLMAMIKEMLGDRVEVNFLAQSDPEHYGITPYSFRPRMAHKLVQDTEIDLGQGILDTIYEVYNEINASTGASSLVTLPK